MTYNSGRKYDQKMKPFLVYQYLMRYGKDDDRHLTAVVSVAVSDQFFGWICGFGKRMKIVAPESVKEKFKTYLDKMRSMYE